MKAYDIPYYEKSSLKLRTKLLFLFCSIFTLAISLILFTLVSADDMAEGLFFGVFMLIICIMCSYMFIFAAVLKKFHIEMTSEYIEVSLPYKKRKAYWRDICEASVYTYNNNVMLAILLEKDKNKKRRTISGTFNSLSNIPQYSFQIPFNIFGSMEIDRLLYTIERQIERHASEKSADVDSIVEKNAEEQNSLIKAIVFSVLTSIGMSLIYGVSIYKIEKNYVAIPIFSSLLIIAVFNKYYLEKSFSLIIRLYVAMICLLQVPIAVIEAIMLSGKIKFTLSNAIEVTKEYFKYLYHNPTKQIAVIVVSVICIGMGAVKGRYSSRKDKNLNQAV